MLTSADLPGFWQEPDVDDDGSADRCVNDNPLLVGENPRGVDGADFTKDDGDLRAQSGAVLAVKPAEAAKAFSDLTAALSSQCLKDAIRDTFTRGAQRGVVVRDVSSSPLPKPDVPAEAAASRLAVSLERGRERADRMRGKTKNTPDTGPGNNTLERRRPDDDRQCWDVHSLPRSVGSQPGAPPLLDGGTEFERRSLHLLLDPPAAFPSAATSTSWRRPVRDLSPFPSTPS